MAKVTLWNKETGKEQVMESVDASEALNGKDSCYCTLEAKNKKPGRPPSEGPTIPEMKQKLTDLGVEFKGNDSKATLAELLKIAEAEG